MTAEGFVLDASTAVAWAFEDEDDPAADRIADLMVDGFAVVPALWHVELANALALGMRRDRIDSEGAERFLSLLEALDIRTDAVVPDAGRLAVAAVQHGLTAYDATYLQLAHERTLPLATRDRALATAATSAGITVITGR